MVKKDTIRRMDYFFLEGGGGGGGGLPECRSHNVGTWGINPASGHPCTGVPRCLVRVLS